MGVAKSGRGMRVVELPERKEALEKKKRRKTTVYDHSPLCGLKAQQPSKHAVAPPPSKFLIPLCKL